MSFPNFTELNDRGVDLYNLKRYAEALPLFDAAIRINPSYGKAWCNKANCLLALNRIQEALCAYERAVESAPFFAEAWRSKAMAEKSNGLRVKSMESLQFFLALAPEAMSALVLQAKAFIDELSKLGIRPHSQEALPLLLKGYRLAGDERKFDESIVCFDKAIKLAPRLARVWMYRGMSLAALGKVESAIESYTKAIEADNRSSVYWYNVGVLHARLKRYADAAKKYTKAVELDPNYVEAWSNLGNMLRLVNRLKEAVECFDKAIALRPDEENPWFNKAITVDMLKRRDQAIVCYKRFLELSSAQNGKEIDLARQRLAELGGTGQPDQNTVTATHYASSSGTALQEPLPAVPSMPPPKKVDPQLAEQWNGKGIELYNQKFIQEAIGCFDKALELDPNACRALFNKAIALEDLNRPEDALECYALLNGIDPTIYEAWLNKGAILMDIARFDEAAGSFKKAVELKPTDATAWFNLGTAVKNLGRFKEAVECLDRALKINPKDTGALNNKGTSLQDLGDLFGALECYERIIAIDPNHAFAWHNKGEVLNKLKRFDKAMPCFDRALKIKEFASPWNGKGEALKGIGRFVEARACFHKAVETFGGYAAAWAGKGFCEERLGLEKEAVDSYKQALFYARKDEAEIANTARERLASLGLAAAEIEEVLKRASDASERRVKPRLPKGSGEFIGQKYEVYKTLGAGGFGVVYHVYSHETGAVYALKTFRDEYMLDKDTREMFKKEAQVLVDMDSHPYLVEDYFVDEVAGRLYIAMEYVAPDEGGLNTLEGYLEKNPPDLALCLKWAVQFCLGIEFVYSQGIKSHRDIKPPNIMITQQKNVKIADFGLAGILDHIHVISDPVAPVDAKGAASGQTMKGASFGTPTHMPPEQFSNAAGCDEQSDIYSFGVVLYQMASKGALPFMPEPPKANTADEMGRFWVEMRALHENAPPPRIEGPLFPLIERCLAKKPEDRYRSFASLRQGLEKMLKDLTGEVIAPPCKEEMNAAEWLNKGLSLKNLGRFDEAMAAYDRCIEMKPSVATASIALSNKGNCQLARGRFDEALKYYEAALAGDPGNAKAWCNKGYALNELGRFKDALASYDKALEISPDFSIAWGNKAMTYLTLKDYEKCIICADSAIRNDPGNEVAWVNKGAAYYAMNRLSDALLCYMKALEINPLQDSALYNAGLCFFDKKEYKEAINIFDRAIAANAGNYSAWAHKGSAFLSLKDFSEAVRSFDKALDINPGYDLPWYYKAYAMMNLKNVVEAKRCFTEFIKRAAPAKRASQIEDAKNRLRII
ncbi:MAG: tetratricopeptide repeat protein [Deltaproteobacteria bacterium]|nr:tetratricopeptide repeat protein [Deltaproteobacteria bacterium]